jgi:hypothetical protein
MSHVQCFESEIAKHDELGEVAKSGRWCMSSARKALSMPPACRVRAPFSRGWRERAPGAGCGARAEGPDASKRLTKDSVSAARQGQRELEGMVFGPQRRLVITKTEPAAKPDNVSRVVSSIQDLEQSTPEAVRKFVDTVDGQFPDLRDDGPRRKIIDSAFKMVEQMVNASNKLAKNIVSVTENALAEFDKNASSSKA